MYVNGKEKLKRDQDRLSTSLRATCNHSSGVSSGTEHPFARISLLPLVWVTAAIISFSISVSPPCVNGPRSASPPIRHLFVMLRVSLRLGPVSRSLQLITETG